LCVFFSCLNLDLTEMASIFQNLHCVLTSLLATGTYPILLCWLSLFHAGPLVSARR
jgi:hypothetical protein